MNNSEGAKALHTGVDGIEYTTAGQDIDLLAAAPFEGQCCREWCVLSAAASAKLNVEVVGADGQTEKTREYSADLLVGKPRVLGLTKINAASTSGIKIFVTY